MELWLLDPRKNSKWIKGNNSARKNAVDYQHKLD